MSEKIPDVPAFKQPLKDSRYASDSFGMKPRLFEFEHNDRYIVRRSTETMFKPAPFFTAEKLGAKAKSLFSELATKYDITAPVNFIVAHDENRAAWWHDLFVVTENVASVDYDGLSDPEKVSVGKAFHDLCSSLVSYYESRIGTDEFFLSDLSDIDQYVYGKKFNDTENHLYLIDTDPLFSNEQNVLKDRISGLLDELGVLEGKYGISCADIKSRCEELLSRFPSDE